MTEEEMATQIAYLSAELATSVERTVKLRLALRKIARDRPHAADRGLYGGLRYECPFCNAEAATVVDLGHQAGCPTRIAREALDASQQAQPDLLPLDGLLARPISGVCGQVGCQAKHIEGIDLLKWDEMQRLLTETAVLLRHTGTSVDGLRLLTRIDKVLAK